MLSDFVVVPSARCTDFVLQSIKGLVLFNQGNPSTRLLCPNFVRSNTASLVWSAYFRRRRASCVIAPELISRPLITSTVIGFLFWTKLNPMFSQKALSMKHDVA